MNNSISDFCFELIETFSKGRSPLQPQLTAAFLSSPESLDVDFWEKALTNRTQTQITFWKELARSAELFLIQKNIVRVTEINKNFNLCSSYPSYLLVPFSANDELLKKVSEFRSGRRIPVITWFYQGVWLCRSSQPSPGILGVKNSADLTYFKQLVGEKNGKIVDCRPKLAAAGNALKGKGTENAQYGEVIFLDIPNIHSLREKRKNWTNFVVLVLKGAKKVAEMLANTTNVLVHCSDGWDRTSQVCALAQIILDSKWRSKKGFFELIQKEFVWFGHQFKTRSDFNEPGKTAPVFLQFLDCVYQLYKQYKKMFGFKETFLREIAEGEARKCIGELWGNSEKERDFYNTEIKMQKFGKFEDENKLENGVLSLDPYVNYPWNKLFLRFKVI